METVLLKTCGTSFEAFLIKHKLENEQIDCFIANEHFGTMMPHFYRMLGSGVQVFVNENDFERASQLIAEGRAEEKIACPYCGSSNITFGLGTKRVAKWIWISLSLLIGTPFNNLNNRFVCKDCRAEFNNNVV